MNPDYFQGENITPKTILATLVHEMCHLWQKYHGKPGRNRYHNQEWAEMMLTVGLHPTSDGTMSGQMTGDKVSHLIIEDGKFDRVCEQLLDTIKIAWVDRWTGQDHSGLKQKNKTKYVCFISDEGRDAIIEIDGREFSMVEFGRILATYAGWGMRICFVPEDDINLEPKIEVREPE